MRRFYGYCIGAPRTGTHSVAAMFGRHYRSRHEALAIETILVLIDWIDGKISRDECARLLRARDVFLRLEMEAAHYFHHVIDLLVDLFPQARFILTVRHPLSWINSEFNQNRGMVDPVWCCLENRRYGCYGNSFAAAEQSLAKYNNVWPLKSYFSYWRDHYRKVLDAVPADRLLVVQTSEISEKAAEIEDFYSLPEGSLDRASSHMDARQGPDVDIFAEVSHDYIHDTMQACCGELLPRFFAATTNLATGQSGS